MEMDKQNDRDSAPPRTRRGGLFWTRAFLAATLVLCFACSLWLNHNKPLGGPGFFEALARAQLAAAFGWIAAICLWLTFFIKRKTRTGFCVVCGYDLRATKERCPECGTPITAVGAKSPNI